MTLKSTRKARGHFVTLIEVTKYLIECVLDLSAESSLLKFPTQVCCLKFLFPYQCASKYKIKLAQNPYV